MAVTRRTKRPRTSESTSSKLSLIEVHSEADAEMVDVHLSLPRAALQRSLVFEQAVQCGGSTSLPEDVDALLLWFAGALNGAVLDSPVSFRQALVPRILTVCPQPEHLVTAR